MSSSDWLLEQYEDYCIDFEAWGHEFFKRPLSLEEFEELSVELEHSIAEECGRLTAEQRRRQQETERRMLTHESYFTEGPRVVVVQPDRRPDGPHPARDRKRAT